MIPEAAVEAAIGSAIAFYDGKPPRGTRAAIRAALDAAAPHMLAAAWDEGATGGLSWNENLGEDFATPNPYRPAQ